MRTEHDPYGNRTICYPTKEEFDGYLSNMSNYTLEKLRTYIADKNKIHAIKLLRDEIYSDTGYTSGLKVTKDYVDMIMGENTEEDKLSHYIRYGISDVMAVILVTKTEEGLVAKVQGQEEACSVPCNNISMALISLSETISSRGDLWRFFNSMHYPSSEFGPEDVPI